MNVLESQIIHIIKKALFNDFEYTPDVSAPWDQIFELGTSHNIIPTLAEGILSLPLDNSIKDKFATEYRRQALIHFGQMQRLSAITIAFDKCGIDYMLLKGKNLKELYPKPEMRVMGDFDILINLGQYDKIQSTLSGLGLSKVLESDHEIIWKDSTFAFVELHKRLFPSYNPDFCEYFGTGWERAKKQNDQSNAFSLKKEDEYIFVFTHLAKHYRDGGIGIRHMLDIYLFSLKNPDMDNCYIEAELKQLGLLDFHKSIRHTLSVWFEDNGPSEISDLVTRRIFESGSYGSETEKIKSSALRSSNRYKTNIGAKIGVFLKATFPHLKVMKGSFPVLNTVPVLLPFMWLVRIFKGVIFKQKALKNVIAKIKSIDSDVLQSYQAELFKVGLNDKF